MNKELTKKEAKNLTPINDMSLDITSADIMMSRLKVMQPTSDLVKEGNAEPGTVVDQQTSEVICKKGGKFTFIVVGTDRYWIEQVGEEYSIRPAQHRRELPWEEMNIKRTFVHNFYVILPPQVTSGFAMPYELPFTSSGLQTASAISKFLLQARVANKPVYHILFEAKVGLKKKGKHSWFALDITKTGSANNQLITYAKSLPRELFQRNYAQMPKIEEEF